MIPIRDINPVRSTPWVTWTLILVCSLVFLGEWVMPDGGDRFALTWGLVPKRLLSGQDLLAWLTPVTSMFLHGGWMHVIGNLWFLHIFGDNVEDNMGSARFTVFYLLSGLAAAAAQVWSDPTSPVPMVGASGAIAGVLAAYMVLFPRARVVALIPIFVFIQFAEVPAVLFLVVWFAYQFFAGVGSLAHGGSGGVAYWAHIGGFVAGLVMVFAFRKPKEPDPGEGWRIVRIPRDRAAPRRPWRDERSGW